MADLVITIIQTQLHWENKEANLNMLGDKIAGIGKPSQVIILPEMFSTGFSMKPELLAESMEGETVQWMKRLAQEKRSIITGSVIIKEGDEYFNRLIWMLPNGQLGYYDKRHLFGFAKEDQHYSSGSGRLIAKVNGWKVNLMVCYDLRFPVWARQQFNDDKEFEYDILVYVANWPERRNTAWKALLQARAIENQCYVVGVNRVGKDGNEISHSGDSMIIDPLGEILYHRSDDEDVFTQVLSKEKLDEIRSRFPFGKDADQFEILA